MSDAPWGGFFSGYERRGFHFGVNDEAQCEIYLIGKDRKRIGAARKIRIYPEVLVELPDGKRITKALKNDEGYDSKQKAGLDHEQIKLTAITVGQAKVEMVIKYSGNRVILDGKILERGTLEKGKLYFSYRVMVPAMYGKTYSKDAKKEKARMRRDKVRFTRAKDKKGVSLKSYEMVNLQDEKMAKGGVLDLEVSMEAQEGRDFLFTTEGGKGALGFKNKSPKKEGKLWEGYQVSWERELDDPKAAPFVIEIK